MDQMENEETLSQQEEQIGTELPAEEVQQQSRQIAAEPQETGFYHAAGIGQRETPFVSENMQTDQMQEREASVAAKSKKKKGKKLLGKMAKTLGLALFMIAMVAIGCYMSVQRCNMYWQTQYNLLWQNMNEKNSALQQQLDGYKDLVEGSGDMADPAGNLAATEIYQQNVNSVVAISSTIRVDEAGKVFESTSSGTGFIITEDGYIVTNHHVIDGAAKILVTLHDGTELVAALVGSDATNDIALLKVLADKLDPVTIGISSMMQVGDQVLAIGNALGEFSSSLTVGYISGMNRGISTDGTVINMIQTDAAINSGNSGGPLFNAKGEVIGITTAKYSGTTSSGASIEGIGFAIPMDDVIDMINDLREFGYIRSAFLGVMVFEVDAQIAQTYNLPQGVYVQEVTAGYCAEKAGVQAKDIIVELGGYQIKTMNDLSRALRSFEAGTTVTIVVWRAGQQIPLTITLDAKPAA